MNDSPRDYDREFTDAVGGSARRRLAYSHDRGEITRFVVQLEYRLDSWQPVVRFDHDPESDQGHDVEGEGVHMDVYRQGAKLRAEEVFPPMPADDALTFAEAHLREHEKRYIKRFEEWHGIHR